MGASLDSPWHPRREVPVTVALFRQRATRSPSDPRSSPPIQKLPSTYGSPIRNTVLPFSTTRLDFDCTSRTLETASISVSPHAPCETKFKVVAYDMSSFKASCIRS